MILKQSLDFVIFTGISKKFHCIPCINYCELSSIILQGVILISVPSHFVHVSYKNTLFQTIVWKNRGILKIQIYDDPEEFFSINTSFIL